MASKEPRDGSRPDIQARAEASQAAIAHQLADAISSIAHTSINALAAMGNLAKQKYEVEDEAAVLPAPPPTKKRSRA